MKNKNGNDISEEMAANDYAHKLYLADYIRKPVIVRAINSLHLPPGSKGLDAGCGIGSHTMLLAEAAGPQGHVSGLDLSSDFLEYAAKSAQKAGVSQRVHFRKGDIANLPFDDNVFDWVWSADCIGYPALSLPSHIKEPMRVVKPGGVIAILAWSSQRLLPGYDFLEARLNASCSATAPFIKNKKSESLFLRAPGWFQESGMERIKARSFAGDIQAPLNDDLQRALEAFFEMLWGNAKPYVSANDWSEYQRLCRIESPDFIARLPDYYGFFTYTMFSGKVPPG